MKEPRSNKRSTSSRSGVRSPRLPSLPAFGPWSFRWTDRTGRDGVLMRIIGLEHEITRVGIKRRGIGVIATHDFVRTCATPALAGVGGQPLTGLA